MQRLGGNNISYHLSLSLAPIQHQQEFPICGTMNKDILFSANSSTVIQHSYKNSTAMEQLCGQVALGSGPCPARQLRSDETFSVFQHSQGDAVFSLQWKGKMCSLSQRGAGLYGQESPPLVLNWSVLMQMRTPDSCSLIGPKGAFLIDQNRASLARTA